MSSNVVNIMLGIALSVIEDDKYEDDLLLVDGLKNLLRSVDGENLVDKLEKVRFGVKIVKGGGGGVREVKRGGMRFSYDGSIEKFEGEFRCRVECGEESFVLVSYDRNFVYRFVYEKLKGESIGRNFNSIWVELREDFVALKKGRDGKMEVWIELG